MAQPAAIIRIKNLRLRTFIGIKEEEINNRQDIVINVTIHYPADKARTSEDINDALNYRTVTKNIIQHVENNRFSLLEKLTQDVLDIAREHHWVTYAEVEISTHCAKSLVTIRRLAFSAWRAVSARGSSANWRSTASAT